jgi:hypothetical protein
MRAYGLLKINISVIQKIESRVGGVCCWYGGIDVHWRKQPRRFVLDVSAVDHGRGAFGDPDWQSKEET